MPLFYTLGEPSPTAALEWTSEGEMRHPVFLGLRTDKKAPDVILERA